MPPGVGTGSSAAASALLLCQPQCHFVRVALFLSAKAASCQVPVEPAPRFVPLRAMRFLRQCRESRGVLSSYPSLCDFLRELVVRHVLVVEDLFDGALRDVGRDAFRSQFGREARLAARTVAQAVPHEGRSNGFVVEKPALFQPIETRVDAGSMEALLTKSPAELVMRACPVREQVEGGVAHADVRVGVEQMVSLVGGQSVPDTEPAPLEGFEHYFERFALVEMDEDFEAALPEGLDARDERVSRHVLLNLVARTNFLRAGRGRG